MVLKLSPELESALREQAARQGVAAEALALDTLRRRFTPQLTPNVPQDEWEQRLLGLAKDCGVSLPDSALTREAIYD